MSQPAKLSQISPLTDLTSTSSPLHQALAPLNPGVLPHHEYEVLSESLRRPDADGSLRIGEAEQAIHSTCQIAPLLLGIDEAGRGPWAGPVVAAAVILPIGFGVSTPLPSEFVHLNDSKRLSEKQRLQIIKPLCRIALGVGVGVSSASLIDETSITQANYISMYIAVVRALRALRRHPQYLNTIKDHPPILALIDGKYQVPPLTLNQVTMIKGDQRSYHIAAASIVAKVTRDKMMIAAHRRYPQYGFKRHKGYGTQEHQRALREHGPCALHRYSFRPVKEQLR